MRRSRSATRRPARWAPLAALLLLLVPTVGTPAGAASAPLVTDEGLGIRVDEEAVIGPVLTAAETQLRSAVDALLLSRVTAVPPYGLTPLWVAVDSQLTLAVDFLDSSAAPPAGAVELAADLSDLRIELRMDPIWPFADCSIWLDAVSAGHVSGVDVTLPPWSPNAGVPDWPGGGPSVSSDGVCWTYILWADLAEWWADFIDSDPNSPASRVGAEVDDALVELLEEVWDHNIDPVASSLRGFDVTYHQARADDHGLIVTADVDATGFTIPPHGSFNVSAAEDSGATSSIDTLLAHRTINGHDAHLIVSLHPNVTSQHMYGLTDLLGGHYGTYSPPTVDGAALTGLLVPSGVQGTYTPADWSVRLDVASPAIDASGTHPHLTADVTLTFSHTAAPSNPVAVFTSSVTGLDLSTVGHPQAFPFSPTNLSSSFTRTYANSDASGVSPQADSAIRPWAAKSFVHFDFFVFLDYVDIVPQGASGSTIDLCTTCGRYTGDQRYTETFFVS